VIAPADLYFGDGIYAQIKIKNAGSFSRLRMVFTL
jgi:hypothetical protein